MPPAPVYTDAEMKALKKFAHQLIQFEYTYTKAQIMDKIYKKVAGDSERAKKAFYCLISAKIIVNRPGGKIVMPNI